MPDTVEREVRFAVVMYGGVSLAIYMNGITQELAHLVRATAPRFQRNPADAQGPQASRPQPPVANGLRFSADELQGTEHIYRRIAQRLGKGGDWDPKTINATDAEAQSAPVRTRFLVDILSGTSAGGINAIFLAKALAQGQSIEPLSDLWMTHGDFAKLLNDKRGIHAPKSLLNSQYMYEQLLNAFNGMDRAGSPGNLDCPQLQSEVDLHVTTTDIDGLEVTLRLADGVVYEKRHRNVFHVRHCDGANGTTCNEFGRMNNPMLAFMARCTSSFPVAFEPMTLNAIPAPNGAGEVQARDALFAAYRGPDGEIRGRGDRGSTTEDAADVHAAEKVAIEDRAFGDGGYLDNKPFSYAIDAIVRQESTLPIQRKLLYLEPSPEHFAPTDQSQNGNPNAFQNLGAALTLARYETIREDLQRVLALNEIAERVERITHGIDADLAEHDAANPEARERDWNDRANGPRYMQQDVRQGIARNGISYGGYHRLKVSALTDEIAEYIVSAGGFDRDSDEFQAIRFLVEAWRSAHYAPVLRENNIAPTDAGRLTQEIESENAFLVRYDLGFRIRRLAFVVRRIDALRTRPTDRDMLLDLRSLSLDKSQDVVDAFNTRLAELRRSLVESLSELRSLRAKLLSRNSPILELIRNLSIESTYLRSLLEESTADRRRSTAAERVAPGTPLHDRLAAFEGGLRSKIGEVTLSASRRDQALFREPTAWHDRSGKGRQPVLPADGGAVAQTIVRYYYSDYERYDQLTFPAFYASDMGDGAGPIEVTRISPLDADRLEKKDKLAGTTLMNFGGFLEHQWRWNDILWGRLDGAERLIAALLPGKAPECKAARDAVIDEIHRIILDEELQKPGAPPDWGYESGKLLAELRAPRSAASRDREVLRTEVHDSFKKYYGVDRSVNRKAALELAARGTRVFGRMLEGISDDFANAGKQAASWVTRFGTIAWGVIEVSVPQSFANMTAMHWLKLLYTFELVTIVAGALTDTGIARFGATALGFTLLAHTVVLLLRDFMARKGDVLRRFGRATGVAGVLLAGWGVATLTVPQIREVLLNLTWDHWGRLRTVLVAVALLMTFVLYVFVWDLCWRLALAGWKKFRNMRPFWAKRKLSRDDPPKAGPPIDDSGSLMSPPAPAPKSVTSPRPPASGPA